MTLVELVEQAKAKSPEFKRKVEYWTHKKRQSPELIWLMKRLEEILGRDYVREAARTHIASQKKVKESK